MDPLRGLVKRQANKCTINEGQGKCIHKDDCVGISVPDRCPNDPNGIQCCLVQTCDVPLGSGFCRNIEYNDCEDGKFVPGTASPWPCDGPDGIQCCVKTTSMTSSDTSTSTSSDTTSTTPDTTSTTDSTSSTPSTTETTGTSAPTGTAPPIISPTPEPELSPKPSSQADSGLSSGQIGGISVGVIAGVAIIVAGLIWMYCLGRRRAGKQSQMVPGVAEAPTENQVMAKLPPPPPEKTADAELIGSPVTPPYTSSPTTEPQPPRYRDLKDNHAFPGSQAAPAELGQGQGHLAPAPAPAQNPPGDVVELPASEVSGTRR